MTTSPLELTAVISEVIENLALMVVEPVDELKDFEPQLEGWIDFTGPANGRLTLRCQEGFAQALAANLLGTEPADLETQANAWDALAELLNVVCGNLVTTMFDHKRPFTLSPPQIRQIARSPSTENGNGNSAVLPAPPGEPIARLLLDGAPVDFTLKVD